MSKQQINNNVVRCWGLCTTAVDQQRIEWRIFEIEVGAFFEDEQHANTFARGAQIFRFGNILVVLGGTTTAFLLRWSDGIRITTRCLYVQVNPYAILYLKQYRGCG